MNSKLIIYVDFDSTLYDTARFAHDLEQMIASEAKLPINQIANDIGDFFADKKLGGYDYEAHIRSYGLTPSVMWQQLHELLEKNDYLYDDSRAFIQTLFNEGYRPHILSFGETRFQAAKIKPTLPHLSGPNKNLAFDVVMRKKNGHIADLHPGEQGVLIDDKPDQDLPQGFTEITLHRASKQDLFRKSRDLYVVRDLNSALTVIHSLGS